MWESQDKSSDLDKTNLSVSITGSDSPVVAELQNLLSLQPGPAWRKGCGE